MVRPDGVVKLTDFGIAQARDTTPLTRTGMVVGTAQYLSPEQAQGMEVTAASDVYSLGVVGFECLAGVRPFDGASQVAIALAHINRPPPPLPSHVRRRPAAGRAGAGQGPRRPLPRRRGLRRGDPPGRLRRYPGARRPRGRPAHDADPDRRRCAPAPRRRRARGRGPGGIADPGHPGDRTRRAGGGRRPRHGPRRADAAPARRPRRRRLGRRGRRRRAGGGRGRWVWLSAALVLLLLLAGGTWFLLNDGNRGTGGAGAAPAPPTSSERPPTGHPARPGRIHRPARRRGAGRAEAAGLTVTQQPADAAELRERGVALDAGDVAGLRPSGGLAAPGTAVVLYVARRPTTPRSRAARADHAHDRGERPRAAPDDDTSAAHDHPTADDRPARRPHAVDRRREPRHAPAPSRSHGWTPPACGACGGWGRVSVLVPISRNRGAQPIGSPPTHDPQRGPPAARALAEALVRTTPRTAREDLR